MPPDSRAPEPRILKQHMESLRLFGVETLPAGAPSEAPARYPSKAEAAPAQPPPAAMPEAPATKAELLADLKREVLACTRCPLYKSRTNAVLHDGTPAARLMFVGEAPGRDEDLQGVPFVGAAGQLLTKMIEQGMGLRREDVYIANVLKDRPPNNRTPEPPEVEACMPFLQRQIAIVNPEIICTLGAVPAKALLNTAQPISRLRGQVHDYRGIPLVPTFHPAYLLRNPAAKREAWADLQQVMRLLGLPPPRR